MLQSVGPESKFYPGGLSVPMLDASVPVLPHFRGFRLVIEHAVTLVFGVHTGDLQLQLRLDRAKPTDDLSKLVFDSLRLWK